MDSLIEDINNEITILTRKGFENLTKEQRKRLNELMDIKDELQDEESIINNKRNEQIKKIKEFSNTWTTWDENTSRDDVFNAQRDLLNAAYNTKITRQNGEQMRFSRPDVFKGVIIDYLTALRNSDRDTQIFDNYDNLIKYVFIHEGLDIQQRGKGKRPITPQQEGYINTVKNMDADDLFNIIINTHKKTRYNISIDGISYKMHTQKGLKEMLKYIKNNAERLTDGKEDLKNNYELLNNLYNITKTNTNPKVQELINEITRNIFNDDTLTTTRDVLFKLFDEIEKLKEKATDGAQTGTNIIINDEDNNLYKAYVKQASISDRILNDGELLQIEKYNTLLYQREYKESEEDFISRITNTIKNMSGIGELNIDSIELKRVPKNEYFNNKNNDCLRVSIKKITGIDYNKDDIKGINDFMDKNNKYFGIYNTYGQLIDGYLNNNIKNNCDYDLILYDEHADILPRGEVQRKKIIHVFYTTFENINEIYNIVYKNKLIYKENTHRINRIFKNEWDNMKANEKIKITVYVNDMSIFPFFNDSNCIYECKINGVSKEEANKESGWVKFVYNGDKQKKEIINYYPYFKELGEMNEEELNDIELTNEDKFKDVLDRVNNLLIYAEKQEKINIDSFPINYRKRCVNIKYENNKIYFSIDMKNAYKNMLKSALNSTMININNIPIKNYSDIEKVKRFNNKYAFIFFVDNCKNLPRGYYYGKYYETVHKLEPNAYYEFYIINGMFSGKKYLSELIEYLDTLDKMDYVKFIGMLLTVPTAYNYESFESITQIKTIKFKYTRLPTIHLNMMLNFTRVMLSKIMDIYKNMGVLPVGYKVDSILYCDFKRKYPNDELKQKYYYSLLLENYLWHSMIIYTSKNEWIQTEEKDDINNIQLSYMFGCAGCGKTTKIINNYVDGGLVIVKNYMLLNDYINKNIPCVLYSQIINNHCFYAVNCLYIEEAGTYTNEELSELINIASNYNINIMLVGDYYQLLPINYNQKLLIEYTDHQYIYNNYRNSLKYDSTEGFIISAILRGYFTNEDIIKRDELLNKYREFIKIGYNTEEVILRWYKVSAINQYNKGIKTCYYMLNNFILSAGNYIDNFKNKGAVLSMFNKDSLYTAEEIKGYEKYFINCNIISFYNTQGKTLNYINIIEEKDFNAIIKDPRMFYVLISRIKE